MIKKWRNIAQLNDILSIKSTAILSIKFHHPRSIYIVKIARLHLVMIQLIDFSIYC